MIWSCFIQARWACETVEWTVFFGRVSPRLLPWPFLPQHLPLAVLTQGMKPELVLLLP